MTFVHYLTWRKFMRLMALVGLFFITTSQARAYSHQLYNSQRSSMQNNIFISNSIEGEFGKYTYEMDKAEPGAVKPKESWQGYGIRTAAGLEMLKFIQVAVSHTFLNMRKRDDRLESMNGSRFAGEGRLSFDSPLGSLEIGGGATILRNNYVRNLSTSDFYGTGYFYSLGLNYFVSSKISLIGNIKGLYEQESRNGGASDVGRINTETSAIGLGLNIWL